MPPAEVGPINAHVTDDGWPWYSVEDAARMLGISTPTVRRRISAGAPFWTLHDGSTLPIIAECLKRPQGTYFQVKLPASLEVDSTEDPPVGDASVEPSGIEQQPSPSAHDVSVTAGGAEQHPSQDASDALATLVVERLATRLAEQGEALGALRATLAHVTAERDASRDETARVTADLETAQAEMARLRARSWWRRLLDQGS